MNVDCNQSNLGNKYNKLTWNLPITLICTVASRVISVPNRRSLEWRCHRSSPIFKSIVSMRPTLVTINYIPKIQ